MAYAAKISVTTSCVRGDTIYMPHQLYVGRCGPDAAAQLQPISYDICGAQCVLLPIAVGAMNINELMNINDVRQSARIFPCPATWPFDLESVVRVTCDVGYLAVCQFWSSNVKRCDYLSDVSSLFSSYSRYMWQTDTLQMSKKSIIYCSRLGGESIIVWLNRNK